MVLVSPTFKTAKEHQQQQRNQAIIDMFHRKLSGISITLIGLLYIIWNKGLASPSSTVSMTTTSCRSSPIIEYTLVEEGEYRNSAFQRYAAFEISEKTGKNRSQQELTVKRWAEIMSKENNNCLTNITTNLSTLIRKCPYRGIFFESKGVTASNANEKQFEFVLVSAPSLYRFAETRPDPYTFASYLQKLPSPKDAGAVFSNLGGDAVLVAPQNIMDSGSNSNSAGAKNNDKTYSHLAAFIRGAPESQSNELWRMVAVEYNKHLQIQSSKRPIWLSTCGLGVAWLHFRLDSEPKYYQYKPFANEH